MIGRIAIAAVCLALASVLAGGGATANQRTTVPAQKDLTAQAEQLEALADSMTAVDSAPAPAGSQAIALACRLHADYHRRRESKPARLSRGAFADLPDKLRAMRWATLPERASCGKQGVIIFRSGQYGTFITGVGQSADGRYVAIEGGIQVAPLAGHGTGCLYERRGSALTPIGCYQSWIS